MKEATDFKRKPAPWQRRGREHGYSEQPRSRSLCHYRAPEDWFLFDLEPVVWQSLNMTPKLILNPSSEESEMIKHTAPFRDHLSEPLNRWGLKTQLASFCLNFQRICRCEMGPQDGRPLQGPDSNEDSMRITRQWHQDRPMKLQPSPFPVSHGGLQTYKISLSDQKCLVCFL